MLTFDTGTIADTQQKVEPQPTKTETPPDKAKRIGSSFTMAESSGEESSMASFDSPGEDNDVEPLDEDFEFSSGGEEEEEDLQEDNGGTETPKNKKRKVSMSPTDSLAAMNPNQQLSTLPSTPPSPAGDETTAPRRTSPRKQQKSNGAPVIDMADGIPAAVETITPEKRAAEPAKPPPAPAATSNKATAPKLAEQQPPAAPTNNSSNAVTPPSTATKQRKESPVKAPPPKNDEARPAEETTKNLAPNAGGSQEKSAPKTVEKVKLEAESKKEEVKAEVKAPAKKRKSAGSDTDAKDAGKKGGATGASKETNAKPAPKKKGKKQTFQDELLQILFYSCKPYTAKLLSQQLKSPESAINFSMLSLVDKGWVVKKEFPTKRGAAKELIWANQDAKNKELAEALKAVPPHELLQAQQEVKKLLQQEQNLAAELAKTLQEPSNQDLDVKIKSVEDEIKELEQKLGEMKGRIEAAKTSADAVPGKKNGKKRSAPMTPLRMKKKINSLRSEWKKRKEKCMDFVEQLADGMEKKVKDVMRTVLDVETDEAAGVQMPPKYDV